MKEHVHLELYTRPTCSDCQDAKQYLAEHNIEYTHKDVSANKDLEKELQKISGTRIVPMFAFYQKGLFGRKKLVKHFIGFEVNKAEILDLLSS